MHSRVFDSCVESCCLLLDPCVLVGEDCVCVFLLMMFLTHPLYLETLDFKYKCRGLEQSYPCVIVYQV
jgi:hypothetical protein